MYRKIEAFKSANLAFAITQRIYELTAIADATGTLGTLLDDANGTLAVGCMCVAAKLCPGESKAIVSSRTTNGTSLLKLDADGFFEITEAGDTIRLDPAGGEHLGSQMGSKEWCWRELADYIAQTLTPMWAPRAAEFFDGRPEDNRAALKKVQDRSAAWQHISTLESIRMFVSGPSWSFGEFYYEAEEALGDALDYISLFPGADRALPLGQIEGAEGLSTIYVMGGRRGMYEVTHTGDRYPLSGDGVSDDCCSLGERRGSRTFGFWELVDLVIPHLKSAFEAEFKCETGNFGVGAGLVDVASITGGVLS